MSCSSLLFDPQNKIRLLKPTICQLQQAELVGPARASRFPSSHLGVHFILFVALLSVRTRLLFCISAPQIVRRHSVTYAFILPRFCESLFRRRFDIRALWTLIDRLRLIESQPANAAFWTISIMCRFLVLLCDEFHPRIRIDSRLGFGMAPIASDCLMYSRAFPRNQPFDFVQRILHEHMLPMIEINDGGSIKSALDTPDFGPVD